MSRRQPFGSSTGNQPIVAVSGAARRHRERQQPQQRQQQQPSKKAQIKSGTVAATATGKGIAGSSATLGNYYSKPKPKPKLKTRANYSTASLDAAAAAMDDDTDDQLSISTPSTNATLGTYREHFHDDRKLKYSRSKTKDDISRTIQPALKKEAKKKKKKQQNSATALCLGRSGGGGGGGTGRPPLPPQPRKQHISIDPRHDAKTPKIANRNTITADTTTTAVIDGTSASGDKRLTTAASVSSPLSLLYPNNRRGGYGCESNGGDGVSASICSSRNGLSAAPARSTPSKIVRKIEPLLATAAKKKRDGSSRREIPGSGTSSGKGFRIFDDHLEEVDEENNESNKPDHEVAAFTTNSSLRLTRSRNSVSFRPDFLPPRPAGLSNDDDDDDDDDCSGPGAANAAKSVKEKTNAAKREAESSPNSPGAMDCSPDDRGLGLSSSGSEEYTDSPYLGEKIERRRTGSSDLSRKSKERFALRMPDELERTDDEETDNGEPIISKQQNIHRVRTTGHQFLSDEEDQDRRSGESSLTCGNSTGIALLGTVIGGQRLHPAHSLDESEMTLHMEGHARLKGGQYADSSGASEGDVSKEASDEETNDANDNDDDDDDDDCEVQYKQDEILYTDEHLRKLRRNYLPPGWTVQMSRSRRKPFYSHPDFGQTWYCPVKLPEEFAHPAVPPPPTPPTPGTTENESLETPACPRSIEEHQHNWKMTPSGSTSSGSSRDTDNGAHGNDDDGGGDEAEDVGIISSARLSSTRDSAEDMRVKSIVTHDHCIDSNATVEHRQRFSRHDAVSDRSVSFGRGPILQCTSDEQADSAESNCETIGLINDDRGGLSSEGDSGGERQDHSLEREGLSEIAKVELKLEEADDAVEVSSARFLAPTDEHTSEQEAQQEEGQFSASSSIVSTVSFASKTCQSRLLDQNSTMLNARKKETEASWKESASDASIVRNNEMQTVDRPDNADLVGDVDDGVDFPMLDDTNGGEDEEENEESGLTSSPALLSPKRKRKSICDSSSESMNLMDDDQFGLHAEGREEDITNMDKKGKEQCAFEIASTDDDSTGSSFDKDDVIEVENDNANREDANSFIQEIDITNDDDDDDMSSLAVPEKKRRKEKVEKFDVENASLYSWRTQTGPDRPLCSLQRLESIVASSLPKQRKRRGRL